MTYITMLRTMNVRKEKSVKVILADEISDETCLRTIFPKSVGEEDTGEAR